MSLSEKLPGRRGRTQTGWSRLLATVAGNLDNGLVLPMLGHLPQSLAYWLSDRRGDVLYCLHGPSRKMSLANCAPLEMTSCEGSGRLVRSVTRASPMSVSRPGCFLLCTLLVLLSVSCSKPPPRVLDLASDTAWEISLDDGPWRSIKVPGGGYNSDLQNEPWILQSDIKDHVTYRRMINLPETASGHSVEIAFGAVNHGCEVYLDDQPVGSHAGPLMPFEIDVTDSVIPGRDQELRVISYPQWHYNYEVPHGFIYKEARLHPDTRPAFAREPGWGSKFSYGIAGYVEIRIESLVHIKDTFVRTSVSEKTLASDLWVANRTSQAKHLVVNSSLTSWNGSLWDYPRIDPVEITLAGNEIRKVTLGPVDWNLGRESYWWPNKPFHEDYRAQLHNLTITVTEEGRVVDSKTRRFGFVEWGEGPYYYTVNGVRINQISDGTPEPAMSDYDSYSLSPAFLPPADRTKGCPESWKRFMRLGISANRTHQSTPTEYMLNVADELGFMLIPESPIRGKGRQKWHDEYLLRSVRELAIVSRNHPSVCRYSLMNESRLEWIPSLIDAIRGEDPTRPLVFEDNEIDEPARIDGTDGHAYAMLHYVN